MNKDRRKSLRKLVESLEDIKGELESICVEETEAMENIPDNLQETERYQLIEEAASNLDEACDSMETLLDVIQNAIS